jgi:NAD(P)-dependent dehydrogenase (short-subunit alcohol dehydrogenase family)
MMLQNKTVVITGAAGGLGEGIARVCHREGANVVIADLNGERAALLAEDLRVRALPVVCDVRKPDQLSRLVELAVDHFGEIHGLVNNAGINFVKPFLETTAEEWDNVIATDLKAAFLLTQIVCRRMLLQERPGGSIVNISSVHSQSALPGAGPYDAAKWGVVGMSKSIAVELASKQIRVNCISPGLLNTQIWKDILASSPDPRACAEYWNDNIPIARVIEPSEIGELAAFLLSERSLCITGANIFADGGMTSRLISREPRAGGRG